MNLPGFFDVGEWLARLTGLRDQLEAFFLIVDFEVFQSDLDKTIAYADKMKGRWLLFDQILSAKF